MKKVLLFILSVLVSSSMMAQLYSEDFTGDNGQGLVGSNPPASATAGSGTANLGAGSLTATSDWFRVTDETMEARDVDGEVNWVSDNIDVSSVDAVIISFDYGEDGDHEAIGTSGADYLRVFYTLDAGSEIQLLEATGNFCVDEDAGGSGSCTLLSFTTAASIDVSAASTLNIVVRAINGAGSEFLNFDNILVEEDVVAPINLASFTAKPMDTKTVSLDWATASEVNNEYFSIEHSTNGRDFAAIDEVAGAINSTEMRNYSYTHEGASKGMNYYRLRQVDTDGTFSFSPIEVVSLSADIAIEVRPTIAEGTITMTTSDAFDKEATIEVYNILGRLVHSEILARGGVQTTFNVNGLKSGHYFIRLTDGLNTHTTRFIRK